MGMTPEQREVYDLRLAGYTSREIAEQTGRTYKSVTSLWERAQKWANAPEGQRAAVTHAGLDMDTARAGWRIIQHDDGSRDSVYWRAPDLPDDTLDRIREAFEGMQPAPPITPPENTLADLCTVYPLFDVHFGMRAWGRETGGQDYDTRIAADDMRHAFAKVAALTPASDKAVLLVGGDFFHADDDRAETPKSRHSLDVDGRQFKVLDEGVALISEVLDRLQEKHRSVVVRVLRGNHDEHSHMVLTFALSERYRESERVAVDKDPMDLFMLQWGRCMIAAHHGDKASPDRLTLYLSDVCRFWSDTRHRHCFVGHVHHDRAKDTGPLRWESLRAFAPKDSYAAGMGFASRRALQAITFHKQDGIVLRASDPVERAESLQPSPQAFDS